MPTLWAHSFYWAATQQGSTVVAPTIASRPGYPMWQTRSTMILPSLFGAVGEYLGRGWRCLRWWLDLRRAVRRLDAPKRDVLMHTAQMLEHPAYPLAQLGVRKTAVTLHFNRPEAWKGLSHQLKAEPGRAENTFRHLNACSLLDVGLTARGSTVTNPQRHFLVELAYQDFMLRPRG